ncbi:MAG TPA: GIY-YIG nuclease family protein [Candidatus Paceibacterota bacterium]|nr:GIY-YIG nuclease family protein [Candidatus Paceibacterota bacterium]
MYYVYILRSEKDQSLYKGSTQNLSKRIEDHNNGSARYSSSKKPYKLVWYCAFQNKPKAVAFEKYLKHGSGHAFTTKHLL